MKFDLNPDDLLEYNNIFKIHHLIEKDNYNNKIRHKSFQKDFGTDKNFSEPVEPEIDDLIRLHKICTDRRVTTILEFGVGWSTMIFLDALEHNKSKYNDPL